MATPNPTSLARSFASSFLVPPHDYQGFTYVSDGAANDDNIATLSFKCGGASGTTVALITFAYIGSTNNIASATLTLPASI